MLSLLVFGHVAGPIVPSAIAVAIAGRWFLLVGLGLMVGASFVATVVYPAPRRSLLLLSAAAWLASVVGLGIVVLTLETR